MGADKLKKKRRKPVPPEPDDYDRGMRRYLVIRSIQRENDIITLLLEGKDGHKDILPYICKKYKLTPKTGIFYITEARNIIKARKNTEIQTLLSIHINRYEEIYKELFEIKAYGWAANALKAKEKLLGFHKQGFHMRVNSGQVSTISLVSVENEYDLSKLSNDQRERLSQLITKAKREKK